MFAQIKMADVGKWRRWMKNLWKLQVCSCQFWFSLLNAKPSWPIMPICLAHFLFFTQIADLLCCIQCFLPFKSLQVTWHKPGALKFTIVSRCPCVLSWRCLIVGCCLSRDDYFRMKLQWKTITPDQERRFSVLRERKGLIGEFFASLSLWYSHCET